MKWTTDQQKIIDLRNRNILVSAAAGSGKTAVLVARIIALISEGDNPIDIDRLLIVTFTNAAAAEMRERIGKAIEEKVRANPENTHLQKQMTLIHSAEITTIHSFCLNVIRNHFNMIDLDPSFRIADEAELTLLKSDVLGNLLEEYYEEGDSKFLKFIECFSSGKTDKQIEDLVLKLHQFSMSYPWPEEWLEERKETFSLESMEEMKEMDWMKSFISYLNSITGDLVKRCEEAISLCDEPDGPKAYRKALEDDYDMLRELSGLNDYEAYGNMFETLNFTRLSSKKEEGVNEDTKNKVKSIREEIKKIISDIKKNYFFQSIEEMFHDLVAMKEQMIVLIELAKAFHKAYAKKKRDKNIVDFNDLEHFALNILTKKTESGVLPSVAADDLSDYYEEIMIDEYQDSNFVQETILNSISKERHGRPNLFMVGDVKQSIYKFRLARPEIFMDKFHSYSITDSSHQRVDLHMNFRSRSVVLDSINFVFEQIMTKKLGNILYDHEVFLYPGADFGEYAEGVSDNTELLLVPLDNEEEEGNSEEDSKEEAKEEEEYTKIELEARIVANRIKEITHSQHGMLVYDKDKKINRRATCSDIVILLRTMSEWSSVFQDVLKSQGILAEADTQTGYFQTLEIKTILNLLKIIDNPRQDIPFTAVLRSPIANLTSTELAYIRIQKKKVSMYEAALLYLSSVDNSNDILSQKLTIFFDKLNKYRKWVSYLPIHELIEKVLDDSNYRNLCLAMPAGDKRKANLDMLIVRAIKFEETSYSGLFHFVRYIEKLDKYNIDYGEAKIVGKDDNTVKIMSIHKSKGLEFPIVFVAGMGKNFNNQDARGSLLIHPDLGLGPDYFDHELRVKAPTLVKKVISKLLVLENLSEELRILYVAMTRAKEKLILVGGIKKLEDKLVKWSNVTKQEEKQLLYYQLTSANSYLDFIIPAMMRHRGFREILVNRNMDTNIEHPMYHSDAKLYAKVTTYDQLVDYESSVQTFKNINKKELLEWDKTLSFNNDLRRQIREYLEFKYPFEKETKIKAKLTVSELKRLGQRESFEDGEELILRKEKEEVLPNFIKLKVGGVDIGTLYHTVLEHMPLDTTVLELNNYLLSLIEKGKILKEEYHLLDILKLNHFIHSDVAGRMRIAEEKGKLYKEKQFVMGVKAKEVHPLLKSEEIILVQGVIDVYFEEEDGIVLLDYKTDGVDKDFGEEILRKRYGVQLKYYEKALVQLTGKPVKEKIIYSFGLNKEIRL